MAGRTGTAQTARPKPPVSSLPEHPTYARDVAPILNRACVPCHRDGQVGPFSLQTYSEARKRAALIAQATQSRYMPPWLPEASAPPFLGHRRLPSGEVALLQQWAKNGATEGAPKSRPQPPAFPTGWRLGPPDLIVKMPQAFHLAAEGSDVCPSFVLPLPIAEDRWVRAVDVRPGSPRIVRAVSLFVDEAGRARRLAGQSGAFGYYAFAAGLDPVGDRFSDWAPGAAPHVLPEGTAMPLRKGAELALMLRCEPDGQPETEQTEVGLYFAPRPPRATPTLAALGAAAMFLRANQTATLTDSCALPVAVRLLRITPHASPYCRKITLTATLPNGTAQTILDIREWNAHWAEPYSWAVAPRLPAGTRLTLTAFFDNTAANPNNAGRPLMARRPRRDFMDEKSGIQTQLVVETPADAPALQNALQNRPNALHIEYVGGEGHG